MNYVMKSFIHIICFSLIFCICNIHSESHQNKINNPEVIPQHYEVGTFFSGSTILVKADIPECDGVIVKLVGDEEQLELNKKGQKVFVWLNVGQVTVKNAPDIYILSCSKKLDDICSGSEQNNQLLGYNSLKRKIIFESTVTLTGTEFEEFIKFKEYKGYYSINNNLEIDSTSDERKNFEAVIDIPSFISTGEYSAEIYCYKNGNLIDKTSVNLFVEKVELPLFITNLATGSPAMYGILAVIIAMIAGITIGLIFNRKRTDKD